MMKTTYKRVRKYLNGDPEKLCIDGRKNIKHGSKLDYHKASILKMISQGLQYKEILSILKNEGYSGGYSRFCEYCNNLRGLDDDNKEVMKVTKKFINRRDIFKNIWSDKEIDENDKKEVYERYPELVSIEECVKEFRKIFEQKSIDLLYDFIKKHSKNNISNLCSFANGLKNDIAAVENSVTSLYSNGILEGNNNRLKMIKRTMYGRAKLPLLRVKVLAPNFFMPNNTQNCG